MTSAMKDPEVARYPGDSRWHNDEAKKNWKSAVLRTRDLPDPWVDLGFENIKEETVTRHMYSPKYRKWRTDEIVVKVETKVWKQYLRIGFSYMVDWFILSLQPFAHGAFFGNLGRSCLNFPSILTGRMHQIM